MDEPVEPERPQPSRRTLTFILAPILVAIGLGFVGNALHPTLLNEHPLWLVAAEPRNRWLLLVAEKVDFLPFLLVATVRRLFSDPLFYLLGALYGEGGVRWVEQRLGDGGRIVRTVERWFGRSAPIMVFLFPGPLVCVLAGATGMSLPLFIVCNVAGTVGVVWLLYAFADIFSGPVGAINDFYARHGKVLVIASLTITALWILAQSRRASVVQSIDDIETTLTTDREADGGRT